MIKDIMDIYADILEQIFVGGCSCFFALGIFFTLILKCPPTPKKS